MMLAMFIGGEMVQEVEMLGDCGEEIAMVYCRELCQHREECGVEGCETMSGYCV